MKEIIKEKAMATKEWTHEEMLKKLSELSDELFEITEGDVPDINFKLYLNNSGEELYEILSALRREWKIINRDEVYRCTARLLKEMSNDYAVSVANAIIDEVAKDIILCADIATWNEDDVKLAVGRVLCNKLGIKC